MRVMRVIPPGQVTLDGARRNNTTQQQSINKGYNSNRILTIEEYGPGRKEGRWEGRKVLLGLSFLEYPAETLHADLPSFMFR